MLKYLFYSFFTLFYKNYNQAACHIFKRYIAGILLMDLNFGEGNCCLYLFWTVF